MYIVNLLQCTTNNPFSYASTAAQLCISTADLALQLRHQALKASQELLEAASVCGIRGLPRHLGKSEQCHLGNHILFSMIMLEGFHNKIISANDNARQRSIM